jgi:hypothetical protein
LSESSPPPPPVLPDPADAIVELEGRLTRIYGRAGSRAGEWFELRHFGPLAGARFDPHAEPAADQAVASLYAAIGAAQPALHTAVAEGFQLSRVIDRLTGDPWLAIWMPTRPVRVLDLDSPWTLRAGGTQALCSGDRRISRQWARAIHGQFGADLDGLAWPSAVLGGGRCVVLWERAEDAMPATPDLHRALADPGLAGALAHAAAATGYTLI